MKQILILGLLLIIFGLPKAASADFKFTPESTSITADTELNTQIDLTLQGQASKNYYLEGEFKAISGSNYFGLTDNNGSWVPYSPSNFSTLPQITTDADGHWQGSLKLKLDTGSQFFTGNGDYVLKIARFTEGGSKSDSDNEATVTVSGFVPVQTASPSPTASSSSAPAGQKLTFTYSDLPDALDSDQSTSIKVEIVSDKPNQDLYIKGAFYKDGSTNYFGKTQVSGGWVKNSATYSDQLKITTDGNGNWSGDINIMPDDADSGFTDSGKYKFKVGKYTASGSGPSWSDSQDIILNLIATPEPSATANATTVPVSPTATVLAAKTGSNLTSLESNPSFSPPTLESSNSATPAAAFQSGSQPRTDNWWYVGLGFAALAGSSVPLVKIISLEKVKLLFGRFLPL